MLPSTDTLGGARRVLAWRAPENTTMNDRAFEPYDKHYHRGTTYRDNKVLALKELARDRAPRWLCRAPKHAHIRDYGCADVYMLHSLEYRNLVGATAVGLFVFSAFCHSLTHHPMNRFIEMRRRIGKRLLETTMGRAPRLQ